MSAEPFELDESVRSTLLGDLVPEPEYGLPAGSADRYPGSFSGGQR